MAERRSWVSKYAERDTKRCKDCGSEQPLDQFPVHTVRSGPNEGQMFYGSYCFAHTRERAEQWRANPENYARWLANNHRRDTMRKHGLTAEQYDRLYENPRCAGCLRETETRHGQRTFRLVVDHDHATGRVRGLLCHQCNLAVANAGSDPSTLRRLADYLER